MWKVMLKVNLLVALIVKPAAAFSADESTDHKDSVKDLYFILKGPSDPIGVSHERPRESGAKVMQMPNLRLSSKKLDDDHHNSDSKLLRVAGNLESPKLHQQKQAVTSLKFKRTVVSGEPKLPSIKFTSFDPDVELREEMPSLDFTAKSLKDGGF